MMSFFRFIIFRDGTCTLPRIQEAIFLCKFGIGSHEGSKKISSKFSIYRTSVEFMGCSSVITIALITSKTEPQSPQGRYTCNIPKARQAFTKILYQNVEL